MDHSVHVLRCPVSGEELTHVGDGLKTRAGNQYPVRDDIVCFLPEVLGDRTGESASIAEFYQGEGWKADESGEFTDTKNFVDTRDAPLNYTRKCIARLARHFRNGGDYLLDAGSGPIAHDGLLAYGDAFKRRVCVDLSAQALRGAKTKLGDRGVYLQANLTTLPIKTGTMDAVTCNHVIYQLPDEQQVLAIKELWRVLKPGGIAVVVYWWWPYAPLAWRIEKLAQSLGWRREVDFGASEDAELFHRPHERSWFEAHDWPFRYDYDSFRVVDNPFMRRYVPDGWRGQAFLGALYMMQVAAPRLCGKHGAIPAILIYKD